MLRAEYNFAGELLILRGSYFFISQLFIYLFFFFVGTFLIPIGIVLLISLTYIVYISSKSWSFNLLAWKLHITSALYGTLRFAISYCRTAQFLIIYCASCITKILFLLTRRPERPIWFIWTCWYFLICRLWGEGIRY